MAWPTLAGPYLITFVLELLRSASFTVFIPYFSVELLDQGLQSVAIGTSVCLGTCAFVAAQITSGSMLDKRLSLRKSVLAAGLSVTIICSCMIPIFGINKMFIIMLACFVLQNTSTGIAQGSFNFFLFFRKDKERAINASIFGLATLVASILGSAILGFSFVQILEKAFVPLFAVLAAIFCCVMCAIAFFFIREIDSFQSKTGSHSTPSGFYVIFIGRTIHLCALSCVQSFLPLWFNEIVRQPFCIFSLCFSNFQGATSAFVLCILISSSSSSAIFHRLNRLICPAKIAFFANIMMAAVGASLSFTPDLVIVCLLGLVFGLGYGLYVAAEMHLMTKILQNVVFLGKYSAILSSSFVISALFAFLSGFAIQLLRQKISSWLSFLLIYLFSSVCFVTSGILILLLRQSVSQQLTESDIVLEAIENSNEKLEQQLDAE